MVSQGSPEILRPVHWMFVLGVRQLLSPLVNCGVDQALRRLVGVASKMKQRGGSLVIRNPVDGRACATVLWKANLCPSRRIAVL